jgi:putative PEP-CTERM system histidine kinase
MAMTEMLLAGCAASYVALVIFVLLRTRPNPSRTPLLLAALLTVLWSAVTAVLPPAVPFTGVAGLLDLVRLAAWCVFAQHLYYRFVRSAGLGTALAVMGALIALMVSGALLASGLWVGNWPLLLSVGIAVRLVLAICLLLVVENLFRNASEDARWNINLICIGLGALGVYDIVVCTDAVMFRHVSPALADGRALASVLIAPLLGLAATRTQRWKPPALQISRTAAFHSASLVVSGLLLLALAGVGEVFRSFGTRWGVVAEVGLVCGGVITVAVLLTSGSGRSHIRALLIDPFFAERYDYRREWLHCIETLSGAGSSGPLHMRAIRAVAQVVDSPAGVLFLSEPGNDSFHWSGSWNMPAVAEPVPSDHPLLSAFGAGEEIVQPDLNMLLSPPIDVLPKIWLAVPLPNDGPLAGFVLVAPPRGPFALDREVFALLHTIAREVATYLAEQRATQALLEAQQLRDFGKRFAFVAHDIKNVSAQLSMLLTNAERHMDNPEFQRDMLGTVRASVQRIGGLLRRLQEPQGGAGSGGTGSRPGRTQLEPEGRLETIAETCRKLFGVTVLLESDGRTGKVSMDPAAFEAVMTHLLNNAVEAAGPAAPVHLELRHEQQRMVLDIVDRGPGMTPEFVRDELFQPFRTSKHGGSGIGAFQARELLREVGGDLLVFSRPGKGTTMRLLLPLCEGTAALSTA